jgi:hypothetical protein
MRLYFFLIVIFSLLVGCATPPTIQSPAQLAATHGYVYANFPKSGSGNLLTLVSINGKKEYSLLQRSELKGWGSWLPAGEYKIAKWDHYNWGEYEHILVKVGQVTDLGSLVPLQIGGYEFVVLPIRHSELISAIQSPLTEYKNYLTTTEPIVWSPKAVPNSIKATTQSTGLGLIVDLMNEYQQSVNKPSLNKRLKETKDINTFFTIAKEGMAPNTDDVGIDASENLYFGADLGQIRVRSQSGLWSSIDSGSLNQVTSVETTATTIYAGYENGTIRSSKDVGKTWVTLKKFATDESILDIDYVNSRWMIITGKYKFTGFVNTLSQISVYTSTKPDLSDATSIYSESYADPTWGVVVRGEYSNGFYYFNSWPNLYRIDLSTLDLKKVSPPKSIHTYHTVPNTNIVTAWLAQGIFSKLYLSNNRGESWKELDTPPYVINDILFADEINGRAIRFNPGMFTVTPEVFTYDNKKNSWRKASDGLQGCTQLLHDDKNATRFCVSPGGNIFSENSQTKKWTAEFLVE